MPLLCLLWNSLKWQLKKAQGSKFIKALRTYGTSMDQILLQISGRQSRNRMVLHIHESRGSHHSNRDLKGGLTQEVNHRTLQKEQEKRAGGPIANIFKCDKMDRKLSWGTFRTETTKDREIGNRSKKDKRCKKKSIQIGKHLINRNPIKGKEKYKRKDPILPWWEAWGHVQNPEEKKWSPSMPHVSAVKNNYILIGILKIDYF